MSYIVLVEPEIPENTGSIARLAANFGYDLRIVNPGFNLSESRKTAKNCQDKLREAKIFETVEESVRDLNYVVGTKPGRGRKLNGFQPRGGTSVMIGRESNGLKKEELELCDTVLHIDTGDYSSINQSHATAIFLHYLQDKQEGNTVSNSQKQILSEKLTDEVYQAVLDGNPSEQQVGRMLSELS